MRPPPPAAPSVPPSLREWCIHQKKSNGSDYPVRRRLDSIGDEHKNWGKLHSQADALSIVSQF